MVNVHRYLFRDIEEKSNDIIGSTITGLDIIEGGKVCIFLTKDGRDYTLDCTGNRAVVHAHSTLEEKVSHLEEMLSALMTATGVSDQDLMKIIEDAS
jgi:hypothetical protein